MKRPILTCLALLCGTPIVHAAGRPANRPLGIRGRDLVIDRALVDRYVAAR